MWGDVPSITAILFSPMITPSREVGLDEQCMRSVVNPFFSDNAAIFLRSVLFPLPGPPPRMYRMSMFSGEKILSKKLTKPLRVFAAPKKRRTFSAFSPNTSSYALGRVASYPLFIKKLCLSARSFGETDCEKCF